MALLSGTRGRDEGEEVRCAHLREPGKGVQEGLTKEVSLKLGLAGFTHRTDTC